MQEPGINHVSGKKLSVTQQDTTIGDNGDEFECSELGKSRTNWNTKQAELNSCLYNSIKTGGVIWGEKQLWEECQVQDKH